MNWLYYLAEANIYLCVFYLAYCLFLTKETYYQLNRVYLLFSCIAAFVLPFLQLGTLKPVQDTVVSTVNYTLPAVETGNPTLATAKPIIVEPSLTMNDYLWYAYLAGAVILLLVLIVKLYTLYTLISNKQRIAQDKHKLVYLPESDVAFSFFNYLFIGTNARGANTIIRHELVHIKQKHSADILFLELLKIISWFNPCIYLLQNSLKTVHEYIADEQTAAYETDALTYSSFLVNNAYGAGGSSLTHSFFNYNLLKKRIIMLNQQRSGNLARLKYLLAVPVCGALLCASTLGYSKTYGWVDLAPAKRAANSIKPAPSIIADKAIDGPQSKKKMVIPMPSFTKDGYYYLQHHIDKTVKYNSAANEKGGYVVVGFTVNNDRKLSNIKIVKSGGSQFDAQALNAFKSFNMPIVNDKPGNKKAVILFYNGQKADDAYKLDEDPNCVSVWCLTDYDYTLKKTTKGYEYDEYSEYLNSKHNFRTVIYEAEGKYVTYNSSKVTAADRKLLKDKYDYTFPATPKEFTNTPPKPKVSQVKFPPPIITQDKPKAGPVKFPPPIATPPKPIVSQVKFPPPVVTARDSSKDAFYKWILTQIKYPAVDRENFITGKVFATFVFDEDKSVSYVKILRTPSNTLGEEVLRVLKSVSNNANLKPGQPYTIPIYFALDDSKAERYPTEKQERSEIYYGHLKPGAINPNNGNNYVLNELVVRGYPKQQ